ncbi:hypothetical protein ACQ1SO_002823 [Pseudomonas aeruginosa]
MNDIKRTALQMSLTQVRFMLNSEKERLHYSYDDYKKQKLERKLKHLNDEMNETSKDGKIYFTFLMAYQSVLTMFLLFLFFQTFGLTTTNNFIVSLLITILLFGSIVRFFPEIHKAGKDKYIKEQMEQFEKSL